MSRDWVAGQLAAFLEKAFFRKGRPIAGDEFLGEAFHGPLTQLLESLGRDPARRLHDQRDSAEFGRAVQELTIVLSRWRRGQFSVALPAAPLLALHDILQKEASLPAETTPNAPPPAKTQPKRQVSESVAPSWNRLRRIGSGGQAEVSEVERASDHVRGALKHFRSLKRSSKARARFSGELRALRQANDPAALRVLDASEAEGWMVTELHPHTLRDRIKDYEGRVLETLEAVRPVVACLARFHRDGHVHRDVKPANVFVAEDGRLVLGDFGLFFDPKDDRKTRTRERVGSRDWIAPWADKPERIATPNATLDVFPLGKLIWCMVAGREFLQLWYFERGENDLRERFRFQRDPAFGLLYRDVLSRAIVENEEQCFKDAGELLEAVERTIAAIRMGASVLADGVARACRVCGLGNYVPRWRDSPDRALAMPRRGFVDESSLTVRVFACDKCGHVQLFHFEAGGAPPAWR